MPRLALLMLAALVTLGTSPATALAQDMDESPPGGPKSANVQASWDLVDESGTIHYELDTAYADDFERAAGSWNELGVVDIEPTPSESETDLAVTDGSLGGPLATTSSDGVITFDPQLMGSSTDNARETAAAHELGHTLGFGHVQAESVMTTPIISNSSSNYNEPTSYDRREYRERWGAPSPDDGSSDPSEDRAQGTDRPQSDDPDQQSPGGQTQPRQDDDPGGANTTDDTPPSTTAEDQTSDDSGEGAAFEDFLSEADEDSGNDGGPGATDQPDSTNGAPSDSHDGNSPSPEQGWTPEECFPFCEDGTTHSTDDESSGPASPEDRDTTGEPGDGETSQGHTHGADGDDHSSGDQTMTKEEACNTVKDIQRESSEGENSFTITVEQRVECDQSSGSDSSAKTGSIDVSPGENSSSGNGSSEAASSARNVLEDVSSSESTSSQDGSSEDDPSGEDSSSGDGLFEDTPLEDDFLD